MKLNKLIIEEVNKYINNIICEASLSKIYQKNFSNIPKENFDKVIRIDPTYDMNNPDKMGRYTQWLLNLYKKGSISIDNSSSIRKYLNIFDINKNKLDKKDIFLYKDVDNLLDAIEPYLSNNMSNRKRINDIKKNTIKFYEDDDWLVVIPKSFEASKYYGANTKWCTTSKNDSSYFEDYNRKGNLYINIDKKNKIKYQFHFEKGEFRNDENVSIGIPILDNINLPKKLITLYEKKYGKDYLDRLGFFSSYKRIKQIKRELKKGMEMSDIFDACKKFNENYYLVYVNYQFNFISTDGDFFSKKWFNFAEIFDDVALVEYNGTRNILNKNMKFLSDEYFYTISRCKDSTLFKVSNREGKFTLLSIKYGRISDKWFDEILEPLILNYDLSLSIGLIGDEKYILLSNGKLISVEEGKKLIEKYWGH